MKKYRVEQGAMVEVPLYESHKRGKNWAAVVTKDPKAPGGLNRNFLKRAYGKYYYFVDSLKVGDVVEFGADYYTSSGRKDANRKYAVVIAVTTDVVELEEFANADEAFEYAKKLQERDTTEVELPYNEELAKFSDEELIRELERRGYKVVEKNFGGDQ
jgi:hypothetical protein